MSEKILSVVEKLSRVGVNAELLEERTGEADVALTAAQFEKLAELLPDTKLLGIKAKKVQACVFLPSLESAVLNNVKAPRVASNVKITSVMMYTVDHDNSDTNIVTGALWDADNKEGYIVINGENHPVRVGKAEEFYEAPEDAE